jgi:methyl-accepting chemotaxis protein
MALSMLVLAAVLIVISHHLYSQKDKDFQKTYISSQKNLWTAISKNEREQMATNFKTFSRNRKLTTALFRKKYDNLREILGPTATRLKALNIADNMMVIAADEQVVFSEIQANTQAPQTAKQALETRKQSSDIELTADGRLVHVVAFPILDRADLVGVGIFEKTLTEAMNKIKAANNNEVVIFDNKDKLQLSTRKDIPNLNYEDLSGKGNYSEAHLADKVMGIASIPLTNQKGLQVAVLHTLEDVTEQVNARNDTLLFAFFVGCLLLLVASVGIYWYMSKVLQPLGQGVAYIEQIAEGDLTVQISCNRNDEFLRLMDAMNLMNTNLRKLVSEVSSVVQQVVITVSNVKSASEQTEQRVTKQHSSLKQLSSSITQLASTAENVSNDITELEKSAESSLQATNESNQLVKKSVQDISSLTDRMRSGGETIRNLEEKSSHIGGVLDVIKNIAEQTNLLALNAAIEAARAGETGRGFAVVADEVRSLAARTQDSTFEIEEVISAVQSGVSQVVDIMNESIEQANAVSEQAENISLSLDSINNQISTISGLSTQVASAAEIQLSSTENMNNSIYTISEMADATAEQSRDFAQSVAQLMELSEQLQDEMKHFRLN